jgi:hypothetical protein
MSKELGKKRGVFEKEPGSGLWWIQYFDSEGRRRREKIGSRSAAIKLVEKRRTDVRAGVKMPENFRAKPITFGELAQDALKWSRAYKKSFIDDKVRMQPLIAEFGDRPAEQITAGDSRKWLDSKAADWSVATQNRYVALLKMTYRIALEHEQIKSTPTMLVKQKKEHNECIVEISTAEELRLRATIEKSYNEHLAEFEIGLQTGMRQSEQFDLTTWERVHLDTGEIRLPDSKSGKARIVHLNARAKAVMRMLHESSLGTGRVFFLNKEPRWFEKAWPMLASIDMLPARSELPGTACATPSSADWCVLAWI